MSTSTVPSFKTRVSLLYTRDITNKTSTKKLSASISLVDYSKGAL